MITADPLYYNVAKIGEDVERVYRDALDRGHQEQALELLARSVGAALSRVDGRRRMLETAPDFLMPSDASSDP